VEEAQNCTEAEQIRKSLGSLVSEWRTELPVCLESDAQRMRVVRADVEVSGRGMKAIEAIGAILIILFLIEAIFGPIAGILEAWGNRK